MEHLKYSDLQNKICDGILLFLSLVAVPGAFAFAYRVVSLGWEPMMVVHASIMLATWAFYLLRSTIAYPHRANFLVFASLVYGLSANWEFGHLSASEIFLTFSVILSVLLLGLAVAVAVFCCIMLVLVVIAYFTIETNTLPAFDLAVYMLSPSSWMISIILWAAMTGSLLIAINYVISHLNAARVEAEEANYAKSVFLATMSHELRTPLNAVIGLSEMMEREVLGPVSNSTYKGYVADIRRSGEDLLGKVSEILDFSMLDSGNYQPSIEEVSLIPLVEEVVTDAKGKALEKDIGLDSRLPEHLAVVAIDRKATKYVLTHILSNAIQYTPEGGTVALQAEEGRREVVLMISDNGVGMTQTALRQAMQPFVQVNRDRQAVQEGIGIGLAISKKFIHVQGGGFDVSSEPGRGTTVTISLPKFADFDGRKA